MLNNAFRVIDQHAADQLGTPAQAAMGSCVFVLIAAFALHCLVAAGSGPLIARATGARDDVGRRMIFVRSLYGAAFVGLVIAGLALGLTPSVVALLGLTGETAEKAITFLRVLLIGGLPAAMGPTLDATFIAMGRTRVMMALQVLAAVLNYAGNVAMIHAGYDVGGTAVATVVARTLASLLGLALLCRDLGVSRADVLSPALLVLRPYVAIFRIGAPISVNMLLYSGVYAALLHTAISPLGKEVNAALGIGFSALEGMTYPVFLGLSQGVSSIVGRRLGAPAICGAFTHDPLVLTQAEIYARTLAWAQPFVALEALAEGVLAGAGVTLPIFLWSVPLNALRVPLGVLFAARWGAEGVWWAINLTSMAKAAGKGFTALRGRWVG